MFTAVSIFQCIVGEMSVGDIKFTFIIILLLLCVFYKSAHVMIDTMWLSVTNGAIVIHPQRLKSDPGGNLLS
ncbi:transposase [Escherichia coli]|uniref:Transposase n=1 Tax=Escherichia coli TaxID=562 RepID=A0A377D7I3_ECOLX|nr:transposase [Escherichia coli]